MNSTQFARMKSVTTSAATIFLSVFALNSACVHLNSVSVTPIPKERSNQVTTQGERMIILGFNFDNDYVNELVNDLKSKCPNGKVTGILTKDEDIYYFLALVMKKRVTATGYCSTSSSEARGSKKSSGAQVVEAGDAE